MIRENLQDAGEIIQNILTQPLSIPGAKPGLSLLQAAREASDPRNPLRSGPAENPPQFPPVP